MNIPPVPRRTVIGLSWCTMSLFGGGLAAIRPTVPRVSQSGTVDSTARGRADTTTAVTNADEAEIPLSTKWDPTGWSGRVVVGEYLTGILCGYCQPHDRAFIALLRRYPSTAFVVLGYHGSGNLPISYPVDSLWEKLADWYHIPNSPGAPKGMFPPEEGWDNWIDGHPTAEYVLVEALRPGGVPPQEQYDTMVKSIDAQLRKAPEAILHVEATPKNGKIITRVKVSSLPKSRTDVYVRVLLVEDTVRLNMKPGMQDASLRTNHYMVVRGAAHTKKLALGLPLHGSGTVTYTFDVAKHQQRKLQYRALTLSGKAVALGYSAIADEAFAGAANEIIGYFPDKRNWQIDPTRLHVVAFVQDARTGDVLQSHIMRVNTGVHGERLKLPSE